MRKFLVVLILSISLFSCNENGEKKESSSSSPLQTLKVGGPNGEVKEYSRSRKLLNRKIWKNGILDTTYYYGQGGYIIKAVYSDSGIEQLYVSDSTNKFTSFKSTAMLNVYSEQDTIKLGDTMSIHVELLSKKRDWYKDCRVYIGDIDTNTGRIMGPVDTCRNVSQGIANYKCIPKTKGKSTISGVLQVWQQHPACVYTYPFQVTYCVKAK